MSAHADATCSYQKLVELTRQLHLLMAQGKGESDEADEIREQVYPDWGRLTPEQRDRVNSLSGDLYMLTGEEIYQKAEPEERTRKHLAPRLQMAWRQRDWDGVLALLRIGPDFLTQDQVAYLRGRCWAELGHPEIALLFLQHAARLNPRQDYRAALAEALLRLGRTDDALQQVHAASAAEDDRLLAGLVEPVPLAS